MNGAAVFPLDARGRAPHEVARWLAAERITIYHSVPSLFAAVMERAVELPHLRVVRLEGDRCAPRHVTLFRERFRSGCVLVNGLGATETGISRQLFLWPENPVPEPVVPVGYPTEDVVVRILDPAGKELPAGEVGEIAVSSPCLARGYWKRPDWTAARFREIHGVRTFLSGDLGRLRPDGCLEHLGRADSRLRVRGTSVDGAAVEAALQALPGVRDARVRPRPDDGGDGIVGYVVAEERRPPTVSAIRRGLLTRLPEHAVPATFVMPVPAAGRERESGRPPAAVPRPRASGARRGVRRRAHADRASSDRRLGRGARRRPRRGRGRLLRPWGGFPQGRTGRVAPPRERPLRCPAAPRLRRAHGRPAGSGDPEPHGAGRTRPSDCGVGSGYFG